MAGTDTKTKEAHFIVYLDHAQSTVGGLTSTFAIRFRSETPPPLVPELGLVLWQQKTTKDGIAFKNELLKAVETAVKAQTTIYHELIRKVEATPTLAPQLENDIATLKGVEDGRVTSITMNGTTATVVCHSTPQLHTAFHALAVAMHNEAEKEAAKNAT